MLSFHKKLGILFAFLQLITFQVNAATTSHIVYASAWTESGIAQGLNDELNLVQKNAKDENKIFKLLDVSVTAEWGYAFILYNLSDRVDETETFITQVAYISAWTGSGMAEEIQRKINELQCFAYFKNKTVNFLSVKLAPEWGHGYIIYEISE